MSNSRLASYVKLSPNNSGVRMHAIDTVSIHCMAGNMSIEACGDMFSHAATEASSNYGIGSDGRIALYVEESKRSWATSSWSNDNRAVTIEVANCGGAPDWPVSPAAYKSLINLLVDICKRNNIKELLWSGNKALIGNVSMQNMTVHRWFKNKACPGNYLYGLHTKIAREVNSRLNPVSISRPVEPAAKLYRVQVGAFTSVADAKALLLKLNRAGLDGYIAKEGKLNKVQLGAYSSAASAAALADSLKRAGYRCFITS